MCVSGKTEKRNKLKRDTEKRAITERLLLITSKYEATSLRCMYKRIVVTRVNTLVNIKCYWRCCIEETSSRLCHETFQERRSDTELHGYVISLSLFIALCNQSGFVHRAENNCKCYERYPLSFCCRTCH